MEGSLGCPGEQMGTGGTILKPVLFVPSLCGACAYEVPLCTGCSGGAQGVLRVGLMENGPVKKGYLGQVSQGN